MFSLVIKILFRFSFFVNSLVIIYKLGCNFLAVFNMYCKKYSYKCKRKRKVRLELGGRRGGKIRYGFDIGKYDVVR